ncbi:EAL domain-containing protein [Shewanella sp. 10N.261.52.F9]|uniref:EAL domain-containing protein n=1 Tax=Shewanella sp. 10N.261.52.F9 TaxID=3229684 RepID=UPI00354C7733
MPTIINKAMKVNLPWLFIAMVLLCNVISYYMVHYRLYKTFSAKVVRLDNSYLAGLTAANKHLTDLQGKLKNLTTAGCSAELVDTLRNYILTSQEQDIVWLKFTDEPLICSALGVTRAFGPHYNHIYQSNELGLDLYQPVKANSSNAVEPIYLGKRADQYRLFVSTETIQDQLDILAGSKLCSGLIVHLANGKELLRFNVDKFDSELVEFKSGTTDLRYQFGLNNQYKQLLRLHYFFVSIIALAMILLSGFLLRGILTQVLLYRNFAQGLKRNEFYLVYQPIVDAATSSTLGVEALLRWRSQDGTTKNTASFIGELELSPLMPKVTRWVVTTALTELHSKLDGKGLAWCSINISAKEIELGQMGAFLQDLAAEGYPVEYLSFELTERIPISDWNKLREFIAVCQELGCKIELDDVGTGYGGNLWLQNLEFDYLKIDQQFVSRLGCAGSKLSLILSYIAIAEELDIDVIAEGVETQTQADILSSLGVHLHQGWLYSKALTATDLMLTD